MDFTGLIEDGIIVCVDVRDMLCAQALSIVARTIANSKEDGYVEVLCNTEDVRRDIMVWAREQGYPVTESQTSPGVVLLRKLKQDSKITNDSGD